MRFFSFSSQFPLLHHFREKGQEVPLFSCHFRQLYGKKVLFFTKKFTFSTKNDRCKQRSFFA